LDVIVDEVCASSCANYVFPAGGKKTILPGALVAWHGNTRQRGTDAQLVNLEPKDREKFLLERSREQQFYARIGVSECVDRIGIDVLGLGGLFTMTARDMARFGIQNVVGAPSGPNEVSARVRNEIDFDFVAIPEAMDAKSACP
jgi:hypothetical protein